MKNEHRMKIEITEKRAELLADALRSTKAT